MNHEGYADPTAGAALSKIAKEENMNGYVDGDIVRATMASGSEADMVLLRCHRSYATAFKIVDSKPSENGYAVKSRAVGYIDTGRPQYVFLNNIQKLIRSMTKVEFTALKTEVVKTLNLVTDEPEKKVESLTVTEVHEKVIGLDEETIKKIADAVAVQIPVPVPEVHECLDASDHDELIKAKAERDVYKQYFTYQLGGGAAK